MLKGHSHSAGGSITYGEAGSLLPVEEIDATVDQYREAELALESVAGDDVIVVTPTSMATGYAIGQHPLTAIVVDSLPPAVKADVDDALEGSIDDFELIQIGKWHPDSPNHSLSEFGDA
ncbi:hypothetical protein [Halobacterium salinarum]|uniref:hypothetical protein n=1 Tax=Halobacterium salinarum TaxID=2242 RepID=UPI002556A709|nr:hypothetical protein [Halobacterium salinarum]MDL0122393.1 hypothetical protein [Halobacterium salinarum]